MAVERATSLNPRPAARQRRALLRACLAASFVVYMVFGAVIALSTWSVAEGAGHVGAIFGVMLFFYVPSIVAPYFIGFLVDKNLGHAWLSGIGVGSTAAMLLLLLSGSGGSYVSVGVMLVVTSYLRELGNILVRKRMVTRFRAGIASRLNGWETTARLLGYLAGTLAGGGMLMTMPLRCSQLVVTGLLMLAWALLRHVERAHAAERRGGRLRTSFARVHRHLAGTRVPAWVAVLVIQTVVAELLSASLAAFVLDRISASPLAMSAISNAYMLGAILGGVVVGRLASTSRAAAWLGASLGALAVAIHCFSLASGLIGAMVGFFFVGLLFQGRVLCQVLIQTEFDREHQAKLQSFVSILSGLATLGTLALLWRLPGLVTPVSVYRAIAVVLVCLCTGTLLLATRTRAP